MYYCEKNNFDIAFIDAKHNLDHVLVDLENSKKLVEFIVNHE